MGTLDPNAHLFWVLSLSTAIVAGVVLGFLRAWWFTLAGVVGPIALVIASHFISNDSLTGAEDLSWRILLRVVAAEGGVLFFLTFAIGARLRTLADFLRRWSRRRHPGIRDRAV
jgi:hypothetical protein